MKISIVGFGQMGQMIKGCAEERGHEVVSLIDPFHPEATHKEFCEDAVKEADVCICFTRPDAAMQNIEDACRFKIPMVIGTTSWEDKMETVKKMVAEAGIGLAYSSNFSIGVNIFFKLLEEAGKVINNFDMYDILAHEAHHRKKLDSPSGTAKTMAQILLQNIDRKTKVCEETLTSRQPEPEELHYSSVRGGHIPGTHSVYFDSEFDTIEMTHTARTRKGFASGSVIAAEWVANQKGLFTERDIMDQILGK